MSSSSYFRPYVRPQTYTPAAARPAGPARAVAAVGQPFPKAREAVLQKKLGEASDEVRALCEKVADVLARPQMHPAEVRQLLQAAEAIQARSGLRDAELERIGWPTQALAHMRQVASVVDNWQACEEAAQRAIGDGQVPLRAVVEALAGLLAAWLRLSGLARGPLRADLGLERRAVGAVPMVSALLDQAMALVRRQPDIVTVRQLEALLRSSAAEPGLRELGVAPPLLQALHELGESMQGLSKAEGAVGGAYMPVPDAVWRAVVDGDVAAVASIIHHGGLVSGRTCDQQGHSVLWDAVAFGSTEVALLLLRSFPPDMVCGVDVGELHPRNGNTLLHLASGLQAFASQAEALFAALFEQMPEALRRRPNKRGQTFLHVAAGRLNTWVLRFAAARGQGALFDAPDAAGWTPRSLLGHHLTERKVASQPPAPRDVSRAALPRWFPLGALQPPADGARPAFADVAVELEDELRGRVQIHAHRLVLATCSPVWHRAMRAAAAGRKDGEVGAEAKAAAGAVAPLVLPLDPEACTSAEAALFALRFLYTGEADGGFHGDAHVLHQLVRLCVACALPAPLLAWATGALLRCFEGAEFGAKEAETLLCHTDEASLGPAGRCYVARRLFASDAAWRALDEERRDRVVEAALAALEPCFLGRAVAGSVPLGSASLGSASPAVAPPGSQPLGTAQLGTAQLGTAQLGTAPLGSMPLGSAQLGSGWLQAAPSGGWW